MDEEAQVTVERTDNIGTPIDVHTLAADRGGVEDLSRPALWFHREDLDRFTPPLERELAQESDQADHEVLMELLREMWAARRDYA